MHKMTQISEVFCTIRDILKAFSLFAGLPTKPHFLQEMTNIKMGIIYL